MGQDDVIGKGKLLRQAIESDRLPSIIFWGPPGSGKTTLAYIIARQTKSDFTQFSAVTSGIRALKEVIKKARENEVEDKHTILFIDEIHRWNKAQQDSLLPYVENAPNYNLFSDERVCPNCGGGKLHKHGFKRTKTTQYQRYQCQGCGTISTTDTKDQLPRAQ